MADFAPTAANVVASGSARNSLQTAGVAITAGQSLYFDTATNTVKLYKANGAAPINQFYGIALNNAAAGQPVLCCLSDPSFTPGFTSTVGQAVIGSGATAGNLAPVADNATGWFNTILGVMKTTTTMNLNPTAAGAAT